MVRIAFFLFLPLFAQAQTGVAGRWRSIETSKGGIGAMFEFHGDGTFGYGPGAVVEVKYRVEGGELILPPGTINGREQHYKMEWRDTDHLLLTEQSQSMTLSRQGSAPDSNNQILGEWTTPREMSGRQMVARYLFGADGRSLFLLPFTNLTGKYTVKEKTIHMEYPGAAPVDGPFRVDGDTLTIPSPRGTGESHLRRY